MTLGIRKKNLHESKSARASKKPSHEDNNVPVPQAKRSFQNEDDRDDTFNVISDGWGSSFFCRLSISRLCNRQTR